MTALDTNVVVRFLTRDDEEQFQKAVTVVSADVVHILDTVWMETEWVLRYAYGTDRSFDFRGFLGETTGRG